MEYYQKTIAYPRDEKYINWSNPKADNSNDIPNPHDNKWFHQQLREVPYSMKTKAADGYKEVYKKEGRSAANERLCCFVKKCKDAK